DDQSRDPQPVALAVDLGGLDVVVVATPVVPRQEDGSAVPVGALHERVHQTGHIRLGGGGGRRRGIRNVGARGGPADAGQRPVGGVGVELRHRHHVTELVVLVHGGEVGKWVPDLGRLSGIGAPADVVLVQQIGQVGPGVVRRLGGGVVVVTVVGAGLI